MKPLHKKGQSLVETTLVLAAFMALLLGMVFVGQTLFVRQTFADRVRSAARWGAVNGYDPAAIRSLVLYGTTAPDGDASPFMGLGVSEVVIAARGCPGAQCRVVVSIPREGIQSTEPAEYDQLATDGAPSRP
jgi:hypothetical protein